MWLGVGCDPTIGQEAGCQGCPIATAVISHRGLVRSGNTDQRGCLARGLAMGNQRTFRDNSGEVIHWGSAEPRQGRLEWPRIISSGGDEADGRSRSGTRSKALDLYGSQSSGRAGSSNLKIPSGQTSPGPDINQLDACMCRALDSQVATAMDICLAKGVQAFVQRLVSVKNWNYCSPTSIWFQKVHVWPDWELCQPVYQPSMTLLC